MHGLLGTLRNADIAYLIYPLIPSVENILIYILTFYLTFLSDNIGNIFQVFRQDVLFWIYIYRDLHWPGRWGINAIMHDNTAPSDPLDEFYFIFFCLATGPKEDSECRVQLEATGRSPPISAESFSRPKDSTTQASQRSVSSLSSASNQPPALKQMTLLVDAWVQKWRGQNHHV